jgi:hypothetical protein
MAAKPDDNAALDLFLAEWDGASSGLSTLEAGLRDARATMTQGTALLLATLGYLVTFELLGLAVARPRTRFPDRSHPTPRFVAGIREFTGRRVSTKMATTLYALRCTLAHEYGLQDQRKKQIFTLTQTGALVRHPRRPWDGTPAGTKLKTSRTWVNVRAVGDLAEDVVRIVRSSHREGKVVIAPGRTADEIRAFGHFFIGP